MPPSIPLKVAAAAGLALMFLYMATAFGTSRSTEVFAGQISDIVEQIAAPAPQQVEQGDELYAREISIRRGDNLPGLLHRSGVVDAEASAFLRNDAQAALLARQLAPGKTFSAKITREGLLEHLVFPLNGEEGNALVIERMSSGFKSSVAPLDRDKKISLKSAVIKHSLFGAADEAGIPDSIAMQLADIFAGDIDFHRDLRKGDRFSVVFETLSHQGKTLGTQRILAAEFINDGKSRHAFWFQPENASGGYYDLAGRSLKKAFLRSPLEFSRITSGFSNARYHPVLREIRAHRGIDYAAPTGTRVKATGNGVVDFAGVQGGYGKVVILRHAGNKTTVYGHLSGFASGIRKGARVSQGEIIGYVGATGIATGPHLHYEFRIDGVHRNPLTVTLPEAAPLPQGQMAAFEAGAIDLSRKIEAIRDVRIALLD
ncbi:MAG: peptidoglycan DD-metalloendopeptidase family protein [Sulfuritalea sp.]|nr:peptidoglycan DD-metalloendopeptidase family protein [Sulfuritalea sp.]